MRPRQLALVITTLGICAGVAHAQEQAIEKAAMPEKAPDQAAPEQAADAPRLLTFALTPRFEHAFEGDLRDSSGTVSVSRFNLNADLSGPIGAQWKWSLNLNGEASWYDWNDVSTLLPSGDEPIDSGYEVTITPGLAYGLNQTWTILGGGIVQFAGESDADFGDALTYGGYGGVRYKVSDTLSFTFGAVVKSRLEEDISFWPLIGIDWQITDKVRLAGEGPGLRLSATVAEGLVFSIFGRYERREFRLADDGAIAGGIVRDTRIPIGVGLAWEPKPWLRLAIDGGVIVYQEFIFDDANGDRVERDRTRPQPFVGISGRITF